MKAAIYQEFEKPLNIQSVEDPDPSPAGVVLRVKACGICRSDWHGWMGNDPDITLPHVPGHELAGEIFAVGKDVAKFKIGDRVTLPFVGGCGACEQCSSGNQQVCEWQFQPGFTAWGGFAEYVAIDYADTNLIPLPDEIDFVTASSLGCRFATSYRAVVDQGAVKPEQWVAIYGCGGVGLSAIMIATALGAQVIAVDISNEKLEFARSVGAEIVINSEHCDPVEAILDITGGGAHISIDALGHPIVAYRSISGLRKRGKHIQVGIMQANQHSAPVPMDKIIGRELEIIGSHGMQAHRYPEMLEMIRTKRLEPARLIAKCITLEESLDELANMDDFRGSGVTVINDFNG